MENEAAKSIEEERPNQEEDTTKQMPIVRFYEGGLCYNGKTLSAILGWPDSKLELYHDFIQVLFPTPEPSRFAPAPTLDEKTMKAFQENLELQASMRKSLGRMLEFFGFDYKIIVPEVEEGVTTSQRLCDIVPNPERFPRAARNWMNSHNDMRITRIIRSLRCCGMEPEAKAFYNALENLYSSRTGYPRRIRDDTFMYWTRAAKRDLRIPPDMSDAKAEREFGCQSTFDGRR